VVAADPESAFQDHLSALQAAATVVPPVVLEEVLSEGGWASGRY